MRKITSSSRKRTREELPKEPTSLLYSINARIGGYGLDLNAHQALILSCARCYLGKAVAFDNRQSDIPAEKIHSLRWHPVRLLSFLSSPFYYDAKKRAVDRVAAKMLRSGQYDFFHGWENNSLESLRVARARNIPSVLEIPTWHRDKGKLKPRDKKEISKIEREARFPDTLFKKLLISRQETLEEYDLADLLLVPSECSAETFRKAGIPEEKLFFLGAGAVFHANAPLPPKLPEGEFTKERPLQAVYLGALIKRKGVHTLLEAWHAAALPHAKLTLFGAVHEEIKPWLEKFRSDSVEVAGFTQNGIEELRKRDLHIFPSECEGSAKTVYEACSAGLAQITTFESGDVVQNGLNGRIVPPNDPEALKVALQMLYASPAKIREYQRAARERAKNEFTWEHFRERLAEAYERAIRISRTRSA